MEFILASGSPRRKELLSKIVGEYTVLPADIDEEALTAQTPAALAKLLARTKACAVAAAHADAVVIGCDTVVEANGKALGKPKTKQEARAMLQSISGKAHFVHTGVCIACGTQIDCFCSTTKVFFSALDEQEIEQYILTEEPYDKAGGYAIQGGAAKWINRIEGCYFNVMGLPLADVYKHLKQKRYL